MPEASPDFEQHRGYLTGLAYRMLGSVAEAEDVVQDGYLRWHDTDRASVDNARAWLSTVVTRLALDRLKSARRRRETYVGPWLPEPLVEDSSGSVDPANDLAEDISFALMLALERLSPLERAAFLLHDVFDMDFEEIAATLDRSAAACRQLASRARSHVRTARPRFHVGPEERAQITDAFLAAARNGDTSTLRRLLAESVTLHSDGGGRKRAALRVLTGVDRICRLYACIARNTGGAPPRWSRQLVINGLPGRLSVEHDGTLQTIAFELVHDRIAAIYVVRNPEKLAHLAHLVPGTVGIDISARTHAPVSTRR